MHFHMHDNYPVLFSHCQIVHSLSAEFDVEVKEHKKTGIKTALILFSSELQTKKQCYANFVDKDFVLIGMRE